MTFSQGIAAEDSRRCTYNSVRRVVGARMLLAGGKKLHRQTIVDAFGEFQRNGILERGRIRFLQPLSFSIQSLGHGVSHDAIIIVKDGVDWKKPGPESSHTKDIREEDGFFVGLAHGVGRLLFETINCTNPSHDAITHVHQHAAGKEKGAHGEDGHDANQMQHDRMKHTMLCGTEEVVVKEDKQSVGSTGPRVDEKETKMFEVPCADAIVHPRTVMIHPTDTSIANTTMMGTGRFEGLALATHGMGIAE